MTGFGLLLILLGILAFFVGIILVCFQSTQRSGLITLLTGVAMFIIGFSVCSAFPMRLH